MGSFDGFEKCSWEESPIFTGSTKFEPLPDVKNIMITGGAGFMYARPLSMLTYEKFQLTIVVLHGSSDISLSNMVMPTELYASTRWIIVRA